MRKEEKNQVIDELADVLKASTNLYITDISELNVETSNNLRRLCFKRNVSLRVVKNKLLRKAMEKSGLDYEPLFPVLRGATCIMTSDTANLPARLIKEFRKEWKKERPILKGALVQECVYIGNDQLETLATLKSRVELIGDIIGMLQSPMRNVIGALQSGGQQISGILKTLSEKPE